MSEPELLAIGWFGTMIVQVVLGVFVLRRARTRDDLRLGAAMVAVGILLLIQGALQTDWWGWV